MKKLFRKKVEGQTDVLAVETSEDVYWETIREMSEENYRQVILVEEILFSFAKELVSMDGAVVSLDIFIKEVEEKDPYYEAPKKTFWEKLLNKEIDPSIEANHHSRHLEQTQHDRLRDIRLQTQLEELTALFEDGKGTGITVKIMEDLVRDSLSDIRQMTLQLNEETITLRTNGVVETNDKDSKLTELLINEVRHYLG